MADFLFVLAEWMFLPLMSLIIIVSLSKCIWPKRTFLFLWSGFFLLCCIIVFWAEPSTSEDLARHYSDIIYIRKGWSMDTPLIIWKILLTMIAKTNANGWLPAINMAIAGLVTRYIVKTNIEQKFRGQLLIFALVIFLGGCHLAAIVSSVRAPMAFAIWTYVYLQFYKDKKIAYYVVAVLCSLIHPVALYAIVLLELYQFFVKSGNVVRKFIIAALIVWPIFCKFLLNIIASIGGAYGSLLVSKFSDYEGVSVLFNNPWRILVLIGGIFLFMIFCHMESFEIEEGERFHVGFSKFVLFFAIVSCVSYQALTDRTMILVSYLALPVVCQYMKYRQRSKILICLTGICYGILTLFYINALLSHETFHGVDFYQMIWRIL